MKIKYFKNKNVYITGGSSGIGLSTAKLLARRGANIIIFAQRKKQLNEAVNEISKHKHPNVPGQKISSMDMDVTKNGEVNTVIAKAVKKFGTPDILINSAGISRPDYFENINYNQFDKIIKVNLYGVRNVVSSVLSYMENTGGGYIVNISSMAGLIGIFGYTDYSASKFAIIGFSEALRSELKKYNIGVSVLCPPDTDTPFLETENKTMPKETKALASNAKVMKSDDVAESLVRGMNKGKLIIIPGFDSKLLFFAKRFFPQLVEFFINRSVKNIQMIG